MLTLFILTTRASRLRELLMEWDDTGKGYGKTLLLQEYVKWKCATPVLQ